MIGFLLSAIKIIFLLGFLILIHESGHFFVAKLCKVKVNEFAIGFGPTIWKKQGIETKYAIRLIPLGGFVSMEGEEEASDAEGSFSKASIPKRMAIVFAGATVNILFGIIVYFVLIASIAGLHDALTKTMELGSSMIDNLRIMLTKGIDANQMMGIVGISDVVASTAGIKEFLYILSIVSISLGVTNLLPIPALDGGKLVILLIEAIRRKPLKKEIEASLTLLGFSVLIALSVYVTYNDILRIF